MSGTRMRGRRSETLSLRMDPKTRFVLEFVRRVERQSITVIVDQALRQYAEGVLAATAKNKQLPAWKQLWHPYEAVRMLRLILCDSLERDYDDDVLREFVLEHANLFLVADEPDEGGILPVNVVVADALWPRIEEFKNLWMDTRANRRDAARQAMLAHLKEVGVPVPSVVPKKRR